MNQNRMILGLAVAVVVAFVLEHVCVPPISKGQQRQAGRSRSTSWSRLSAVAARARASMPAICG